MSDRDAREKTAGERRRLARSAASAWFSPGTAVAIARLAMPGSIWLYASCVSQRPDILLEKRALRSRIKTWRASLAADAMARAADAVAEQGLSFLEVGQKRAVVSGFSSLPEEFRAWPLLRRLNQEGYPLAMPVMRGKSQPLLFRAWAPGDAMNKAVWGIAEPKADKAELEPDIVLAPLLAFDALGWRLGYGGGYYDRTLRALRAHKPIVAVGLAYDEQQVDAVPHLDYDERLDWVLRPSGPLRCGD